MTDRARRIQRLRRRVAVAMVATFAAAFSGVAATGSMGSDDAAATTATTTRDDSGTGTAVTTAAAPSAMTTRQS
jgi:hypothetical protein